MHHAGIRIQNDHTPNLPPCDTLMHGQLGAMLCQEENAYKCTDYIGSRRHINTRTRLESTNFDSNVIGSRDKESSNVELVNDIWREKICEWSYEVVDHFEMDRETVAISLNLLDRFLAKVNCKKKDFLSTR